MIIGDIKMSKKIEFAVFVKDESCKKSLYRQVVLFLVLGLFIYVSRGSTWWTLVTGSMFVFGLTITLKNMIDESNNEFKTKKDLLDWVNSLPDDENSPAG